MAVHKQCIQSIADSGALHLCVDSDLHCLVKISSAVDIGMADTDPPGYYGHIGIYAFRKEAIMKFTKMMQTENEKTHKLEQLRVLDNGLPIHVIMTDYTGRGIDTEEDLKAFAETNG